VSGETYEVLDQRFARLVKPTAKLELLDATSRWAEGPAYVPAGRYLLWSDVPGDRIMRWDEGSGDVSVFRAPSQNANGNTLDRQGRLVTCEHLTRRVTRTEHDGSITVVAAGIDRKRFNSPNDVIVASDGAIWFTDPTYGIDSDYEGRRAASEIGQSRCTVSTRPTVQSGWRRTTSSNQTASRSRQTSADCMSPTPADRTSRTVLLTSESSR
jgi:gluconolactonase